MKTKEPFVQKLVHKAAQGIVRRERYGWPPPAGWCLLSALAAARAVQMPPACRRNPPPSQLVAAMPMPMPTARTLPARCRR